MKYKLKHTVVPIAGVMRCCLSTVGCEFLGKDGNADREIEIGEKSACQHCKQTFTLIEDEFGGKVRGVWKPDWQIEQDRKK